MLDIVQDPNRLKREESQVRVEVVLQVESIVQKEHHKAQSIVQSEEEINQSNEVEVKVVVLGRSQRLDMNLEGNTSQEGEVQLEVVVQVQDRNQDEIEKREIHTNRREGEVLVQSQREDINRQVRLRVVVRGHDQRQKQKDTN